MTTFKVTDHGSYTECDIPQRTPEWLALRAGKVTGSNFGAALSVSPYKSARALQADFEQQKKFRGNAYTNHGTHWELPAIMLYEQLLGLENREVGFAWPNKLPFIGVSPDGCPVDPDTGSGGLLLEVKCPATSCSYGGVPEHYMAQVQGVMAVLGLKLCHFVVYRPRGYRRPGSNSGKLGPFDVAFGAPPTQVGWELCPDELYGPGCPLEDQEDDLGLLLHPATLEVWEVPASHEYQVALFKGLRWFWGKVVAGEEIPTPGKGGVNPHRKELLLANPTTVLMHHFEETEHGWVDQLKEPK